jgi:hypothetical protein
MVKDTYSSECILFNIRICMSNKSNAMREALIESTKLKSHRDMIHVLNLCRIAITFERMNNLVDKILIELPITLLESIEVVEERIQ